jgi:Gpi18-like mannosyltransferase
MALARVARPQEQEVGPAEPTVSPYRARREQLRSVWMAWCLSRAVLLVVTLCAVVLRQRSPVHLWMQWDAQWYTGIALHGYTFSIHGKPALAFFPLYPAMLRLGTTVGLPVSLAGLLVSNAAFLGALLYMRALADLEVHDIALRRGLTILALFPAALFTFAPYSESLFLLCAVAAMYHARRDQLLIAAFWAAAAVLTRSTGIILLPALPLAVNHRRLEMAALVTALTSAAFAVYMIYLNGHGMSISTLLTAQRAWHRGFGPPWIGFTASITWLARHATQNLPWAFENLIQMAVTIEFLVLTVLAWRSFPGWARAYCAGFWALVLCTPEWHDGYYAPFSSMDRFVFALFPLALWAGTRLTARDYRTVLWVSIPILAGAGAVQLAGGWVG